MSIVYVVKAGERYVAVFPFSHELANLVRAAGFQWDARRQVWWTTDVDVVGNVDPDAMRRAYKELARAAEAGPHSANSAQAFGPIEVQYGELARPAASSIEVQLAAILSRKARSDTRESSTSIGPGWVYVLTNPAHSDFIKIGFSTDAPEYRASEISRSTGVPFPFEVAFKIYVRECDILEALVHAELKECRANRRREFFKISVEEAAKRISSVAAELRGSEKLVAYLRVNGKYQTIEGSSVGHQVDWGSYQAPSYYRSASADELQKAKNNSDR